MKLLNVISKPIHGYTHLLETTHHFEKRNELSTSSNTVRLRLSESNETCSCQSEHALKLGSLPSTFRYCWLTECIRVWRPSQIPVPLHYRKHTEHIQTTGGDKPGDVRRMTVNLPQRAPARPSRVTCHVNESPRLFSVSRSLGDTGKTHFHSSRTRVRWRVTTAGPAEGAYSDCEVQGGQLIHNATLCVCFVFWFQMNLLLS